MSNRPSVMNERTIWDRIESRFLTLGFVDHKLLERELLICQTFSGGRICSEVLRAEVPKHLEQVLLLQASASKSHH